MALDVEIDCVSIVVEWGLSCELPISDWFPNVILLLSASIMADYGFNLKFLLSLIESTVGYFIRSLGETPFFRSLKLMLGMFYLLLKNT